MYLRICVFIFLSIHAVVHVCVHLCEDARYPYNVTVDW